MEKTFRSGFAHRVVCGLCRVGRTVLFCAVGCAAAITDAQAVGVPGSGPSVGCASTAGSVNVSPCDLFFDDLAIGEEAYRLVRVSNLDSSELHGLGAAVTGTAFVLATSTCPQTLAAFQDCTFTIRFRPNARGATAGSFEITFSGSPYPYDGRLEGRGLGTTPGAFGFVEQADVARSSPVISEAIAVSGLDTAVPISIANGEYSVGCNGAFTSAAGLFENNATVCVRHVSGADYSVVTTTTLTIGGVGGVFTSRTVAAPPPSPPAARVMRQADFNADGRSDLLWFSPQSGWAATWTMNGSSVLANSPAFAAPAAGYEAIGSGDFDGDGTSDILWYRATDRMVYVQLLGSSSQASGNVGEIGAGWELAAISDFNGDGRSDLLWFNPSSGLAVAWFMNGKAVLGGAGYGPLEGYEPIGAGDFNGDGSADILWMRPSDRTLYVQLVSGSSSLPGGGIIGQAGAGWEIRDVSDFNGDGKADLLWFNPANGWGGVWWMDGNTVLPGGPALSPMPGYEIVASGDFNGDGKADVLWYRASDRMLYLQFLEGSSAQSGPVGQIGAGWQLRNWVTSMP